MLTTRALGTQGLTVSAIGLGCMGMSQSYGTPNDEESVAPIRRALELGVTLFDTAEVYGPYTSETLLGGALVGRRDRAIIATKFGWEIGSAGRGGRDSRPSHIRAAAVVSEVAARLGATPGQVALAWVPHQGPDLVPIPGTKRRRFLEENVAAADLRLAAATWRGSTRHSRPR